MTNGFARISFGPPKFYSAIYLKNRHLIARDGGFLYRFFSIW